MISSVMMEKKAFSSSRLLAFYFLTYSANTSITSLWMILDVYCAFFLPVSRCSGSVSSRLAIISRIAQKFLLLDDCPIIPVASKWQVLFSTKYNCFSIAFQDVFLVHLLVGLAQLINELMN